MTPVIETDRLVLREHRAEDHDAVAALWADPDIMRHIGDPCSRQDSWFRMLRYRGLWPMLGYGYWAIREKHTDRYVGDVGLADFKRDAWADLSGIPEMGWVLAAWAHGRGLASEAVAGALGWFDRNTAHRQAVCLVDAGNAASIRVAEKNGFVTAPSLRVPPSNLGLMVRQR